MFVRVKNTPNSPRKSVQIVSSVRKGDKVSQKIVRYVGIALNDDEVVKLKDIAEYILAKMENEAKPSLFTPEQIVELKKQNRNEKLRKINEDDQNFQVDLKKLKEDARVIDGIHQVAGKVYEQLSFDDIFPARKKGSNKIFKELVLARFAQPKSKLATSEMLQKDFGVRIDVNAIYRMMDNLDDKVIQRLQNRAYQATKNLLNNKIDVLFFDTTTLYFESFFEDDFKKNGFSKDLKFNQPQVLFALLVTKEGLPIGYKVFPGNTYEGDTLIPCLKEIKQDYQLDKVVFVADSGLFNQENLKALDKEGFEYIVGARIKNQTKETANEILKKEDFTKLNEELSAKELSHKHGRLIISYSATRARKDDYDRKIAIERLSKKLKRNGKLNAQDLISNYGYKKFIKADQNNSFQIDEEKIKQASAWDGLHGIITNSKDKDLADILNNYRQLWKIEEAFRVTKTDLRIRPIYHYVEKRIKAHIAINFAALCLAKNLHYRVAHQYKPLSINKIREELLTVQSSIYYYPKNGFTYILPGKLSLDAQKIYQVMGIKNSRQVKIISFDKQKVNS